MFNPHKVCLHVANLDRALGVCTADLDVQKEHGDTALDMAAKARQLKAMAFLLQHGAKLNAK